MPELLRGRYQQLEVVGSGGQGRVVKALDHLHDRAVALKVRAVRSEADRGALLSEARILFGLPPSPHLPIVREDFFDGDDYVIVMDWVAGTNLDRILHTEGRPGLPPTLVLGWLADAAAALPHLHNQPPPADRPPPASWSSGCGPGGPAPCPPACSRSASPTSWARPACGRRSRW